VFISISTTGSIYFQDSKTMHGAAQTTAIINTTTITSLAHRRL